MLTSTTSRNTMDKFETIKYSIEELKDIKRRVLDGSYVQHLIKTLSEAENGFKTFVERVSKHYQECHAHLQKVEKDFAVGGNVKETLGEFTEDQFGSETTVNALKSQLLELHNFPVLEKNDKFNALLQETKPFIVRICNPKSDVRPLEFTSSVMQITCGGSRVTAKRQLISTKRKTDDHDIPFKQPGYDVGDVSKAFNPNHTDGLRKYDRNTSVSNRTVGTPTFKSRLGNNMVDNSTSTDSECRIDIGTQTTSDYDANDIVVMSAVNDKLKEKVSQEEKIKHDDNDDSDDETNDSGDKVDGRKKIPQLSTDGNNSKQANPTVIGSGDIANPGSTEHEGNSDASKSISRNSSRAILHGSDFSVSRSSTMISRNQVTVPHIEFLNDGCIKVSSWADLALIGNYVVLATREGLLKIERTSCNIVARLNMKSIMAICEIKESSDIGVLLHQNGIAVVSTDGVKLSLKYKLDTKEPFSKICHLSTSTDKEPNPSYRFALIISSQAASFMTGRRQEENVAFVYAQPGRYDKRLPVPIYSVSCAKFSCAGIKSITGIGSFQSDLVVLCTPGKVVCLNINNTGKTEYLWDIKLGKNATDIVCTDLKAYICVKDEGKIMMVNKHGDIEMDNILEGKFTANPDRISVYDNTVIMKEFETEVWGNTIRSSNDWC